MLARQHTIVAVALLLIASGCHVSRLTQYPEFAEKKKNLGELTILTDCMILQGVAGDTDKIDVVQNKDIGVATLQELADRLREKGYSVRQSMLTSVGLLMNHNQPYRVAATSYDVNTSTEDLPIGTPPFYLDPSVERDSTFRLSLAYLYTSALNSGQKEDGVKTVIPYAVPVGKLVESKTIVVLLTGGINVNLTKEASGTFHNRSQTEELVGVRPETRLSVLLYVLDTATGEVIWEDRVFKNGGFVTKDKVVNLVEELSEDFP